MPSTTSHRFVLQILLGVAGLGMLLHVSGLSATLPLGDDGIRGFLLVPSLPTPLYVIMALVVVAGVGLTLLASFRQRRRKPVDAQDQRVSEPLKSPWQLHLSLLVSGLCLFLGIFWLIRYGPRLRQWLDHWRHELHDVPGLLANTTHDLMQQVDSPVAGYVLFVTVIIIYGGLAALGLWVLLSDGGRPPLQPPDDLPGRRQVRRAFAAGLHDLKQHADPRLAIITCYARLEHLLEDHGVPADPHLTPQEHMGTALQGLDLPEAAFAGLVALFEQARYSLHPLDDSARQAAIAHLETLRTHLEWEAAGATHA